MPFPVSDHCDGTRFFNPRGHVNRYFADIWRWKRSSKPAQWPKRVEIEPKEAKPYRYTFEGNVPGLVGSAGEISIFAAAPEAALRPDPLLPHWWTDDPDSGLAEGPHQRARSVSQWREQFLSDFADRLERCR